MPEFQLSAELRGHEKDVRSVIFPSSDFIVSGSRDMTAVLWRKSAETANTRPKFTKSGVLQSQHYVNSLAYQPASQSGCPDGLVLRGCGDNLIEVNNPASPDDDFKRLLVGHSSNVCALDISHDGSYLVSGSWDGQSIVWSTKTWDPILSLTHGEESKSVWAVLPYSEDVVITGCADTYIRIFKLQPTQGMLQKVAAQQALKTDDVVRALCRFPVGGPKHPTRADFASAGNDSIIRLWKIDGTQVASLYGHESFIYSLACLPTAELVSSGEDRTVRIWRDRECVQTITLPAISVWQVAVCKENGDIASATSDHVVRIFTRSADRVARPDAILEFDAAVQQSTVKGNKIDRKDLKTREWLTTARGTKHKQAVMVTEEDGSVSAYQWSEATDKWDLLGTVMESSEAASQRPKVSYKGKEYDYVFDVDTEDGKPAHKLPYNLGEDTYQAATKFLNDNELPISYLEAVAAFIRQNTADAQQGAAVGASASPNTQTADTDTGESHYLPHTKYLTLVQGKLEAAFKKLQQLNEGHLSGGNKHISMNPDDLSRLETLARALSTSSDVSSPNESIQTVVSILTQWPYNNRLPALDILRVMALRPGLSSFSTQRHGTSVDLALRAALDTRQFTRADETDLADFIKKVDWTGINPNNLMMALRVIVNLFSTIEGRVMVAKEAGTIISLISRILGIDEQKPVAPSNLNLQAALITTALNYACLGFNERQAGINLKLLSQLLGIAAAVIRDQEDAELLFRAAMTIGMVLVCGHEAAHLVPRSELDEVLGQAYSKTEDARIKGVWQECKKYLAQ